MSCHNIFFSRSARRPWHRPRPRTDARVETRAMSRVPFTNVSCTRDRTVWVSAPIHSRSSDERIRKGASRVSIAERRARVADGFLRRANGVPHSRAVADARDKIERLRAPVRASHRGALPAMARSNGRRLPASAAYLRGAVVEPADARSAVYVSARAASSASASPGAQATAGVAAEPAPAFSPLLRAIRLRVLGVQHGLKAVWFQGAYREGERGGRRVSARRNEERVETKKTRARSGGRARTTRR